MSLAIALAGGIWLVEQRESISVVEEQTALLEKQVAIAVRQETQVATVTRSTQSPAAISSNNEPIDWARAVQRSSDQANLLEKIELDKRLAAMSLNELIAALEETRKQGLPEEWISRIFIPALAAKDPRTALDRFSGLAGDDFSVVAALQGVLKTWAGKDLEQACGWLDSQIAGGKLMTTSISGVNAVRAYYERVLVGALISSNPELAGERIGKMTEEEAHQVLRGFESDTRDGLKKEDHATFARIARAGLPEAMRLDVLSDLAGRLSEKGDTEVAEYLAGIQATPVERDSCVATAVAQKISNWGSKRAVTFEEVDTVRGWALSQNAEGVDTATGKALGKGIHDDGMSFGEAADLALHYQETPGGDDILVGFLSTHTNEHCAEAHPMAEKIKDPVKRAALVRTFR